MNFKYLDYIKNMQLWISRRHIRTVHINAKDYMCTYCNKKYKHKFDLEKHFAKVGSTENCPTVATRGFLLRYKRKKRCLDNRDV